MRFSEPVMVVLGPPRWSTIAVITQLSSLAASYPPICLFYSQISHSVPPLSLSASSVLVPRGNPLLPHLRPPFALPHPSPGVASSSPGFHRQPPRSLRFLPAFISIRAFPSAAASSRSVIIPSIPSRSFRPHIIKGCALTHAAAHVQNRRTRKERGAGSRPSGPPPGPRNRIEIVQLVRTIAPQ